MRATRVVALETAWDVDGSARNRVKNSEVNWEEVVSQLEGWTD